MNIVGWSIDVAMLHLVCRDQESCICLCFLSPGLGMIFFAPSRLSLKKSSDDHFSEEVMNSYDE